MAPSPDRVARIMLSWHSLELVSCTNLQTLWAGYGHICALSARATTPEAAAHLSQLCGVEPRGRGTTYPLILKLISPPGRKASTEDEGHLRKMLSYEVEQWFYTEIVPQLGDEIGVAKCLASTRDMHGKVGEEELRGLTATIMVDLRPRYPVAGGKRSSLDSRQVHAALDWLAAFHSRSWALLTDSRDACVLPPLEEARKRRPDGIKSDVRGLWLNGGYTYLATRRKEYAALVDDVDSEWSEALCSTNEGFAASVAEMVATVLTPAGRSMESYIHGDVKSENLFTTAAGEEVAFFDFQYVGLGLGVCDLAKLFTCSVPLGMLVDDEEDLPEQLPMRVGEKQLLEAYRRRLLRGQPSELYDWDTFRRHWESALVDWCRFQASWGFWGNTEWLEARVRYILNDQEWRDWLHEEIRSRGS
ncbi:uncharacterized protein BP01DRAFT_359103 [Aspergillus saccharolyticus JOP 1030-1]|uniref:Aminoglycoside phosphotransferase domain-containing protein n=1 Tax=Aspergillus saccharolyticus JOP 1030-1 TaxID=1450539 RepID=A0A318ZGT1_9EURO|nr:hypothetical protein BP01DRAFT_359103 [Aspergillus saccharolyticus JOP 1030-1]PYH42870.1 hypothetical protein BP01DRAFT_359103 [Aspergillus saccharolyticus JOP 1030-1]